MSSTCVPSSLLSQGQLGSEMTSAKMSLADHQKLLQEAQSQFKANSLLPLKESLSLHNAPRMQINYQGMVSVVAHEASGPIYPDAGTHLDDSGDDFRESPSSPYNKTSSEDHKDGSDSDGGRDLNRSKSSGVDSLERLRQICNQNMPTHGHNRHDSGGPHSGLLDSSLEGDLDGSSLFHCHLCPFGSSHRDEFNDHVNNHYEFRCPKCNYSTKVENDYRLHLKDEHNLTPEDFEDDQAVHAPKINSQGKVKTFKCKQCEYVTVTKEEFWKHSKGHIKPEKMLACPKCSFVTEFKHHLEYHLRNHFGSKPFKCPQCNYSCVNKSMLNSHMKSHTTIYQYRCADCNYATKYCHSLKLHLRKYDHKPAMVLNPDGTPNPLPIVDVYGTRRGPKLKRDEHGNVIGPASAKLMQQQNESGLANSTSAPGSPMSGGFPLLGPYMMAQMKMQQMKQPFSPQGDLMLSSLHKSLDDSTDDLDIEDKEIKMNDAKRPRHNADENMKLKCVICDFDTMNQDIFRNHMMLHATRDFNEKVHQPKGSPTTKRNKSPAIPMSNEKKSDTFNSSRGNHHHHIAGKKDEYLTTPTFSPSDYLEYLKRMAPLLNLSADLVPSPSSDNSAIGGLPSPPPTSLLGNPFLPGVGNGGGLLSQLYLGSVVKNFKQREASGGGDADSNASSGGALDLSQGFETKSNGTDGESGHHHEQVERCSSTNGSSKSRRKGRAYKIEQKTNGGGDEADSPNLPSGFASKEDENLEFEEFASGIKLASKDASSATGGANGSSSDHEKQNGIKSEPGSGLTGNYLCAPCRIAFMDPYMYSCHKDCHDPTNPLRCSKCQLVLEDSREFFLHLIQESHQ